MASATTQMQLLISRFPEHIRKMPMKKFLKEHCPNTRVNSRADGTLYFDLVQDSAAFTIGGVQPPGGILNFNSLNFNTGFASARNTPGFNNVRDTPGFASVQNTPGFGPSQTSTIRTFLPILSFSYRNALYKWLLEVLSFNKHEPFQHQ